jgi:uncharacterized RDD family membrane protein YckC
VTGPAGGTGPVGPTDPAPWATPPSPIPSYRPPAPGQVQGPQDGVGSYPAPAPAPFPAPTPPPTPQLRYADWGERVGATLVDWGILLAPLMVLNGLGDAFDDLAALAWLGLAGYLAWLNGSKGQSPGKALMGLKVVRDADGSTLGGPVGLVRAVLLSLMFGLTAGLLWVVALLWPAWDPKKRALHDKMVSASVVAGYPRARVGKGIFLP